MCSKSFRKSTCILSIAFLGHSCKGLALLGRHFRLKSCLQESKAMVPLQHFHKQAPSEGPWKTCLTCLTCPMPEVEAHPQGRHLLADGYLGVCCLLSCPGLVLEAVSPCRGLCPGNPYYLFFTQNSPHCICMTSMRS